MLACGARVVKFAFFLSISDFPISQRRDLIMEPKDNFAI